MRVLVLLLALSGVAYADVAAPPKVTPEPVPTAVRLSHQKQFELSIRFATGLRAIVPYDNEGPDAQFCGDTDATRSSGLAAVCTGRSPFSIDFEVGYGVARKIDAFLELRLGLETDFGSSPTDNQGTRQFHISPGARFFFSDAGASKLFTTAQLVLDTSGYKNVAGGGLSADFGLRNMNGLWFDLDRAYGFYVFVAETATFSRWLRFELEAGVGIQGRYP